jgi:nitrate reductase NapE
LIQVKPQELRKPTLLSRQETAVNNKEALPTDVRTRETRVFVFLTVVLAPALAVALVGAYGLAIWVYQMLMGPPRG